jgi:hypothetical protein
MDGVHPAAPGERVTGPAVLGAGLAAVLALAVAVPPPPSARSAARQAADRVLSAGDRADGLPLTAVLRPPDETGPLSYVYGDCRPSAETGCAAPAEVQVWPACRRHLGLYRDPVPGMTPVPTAVRGVRALSFDGGRRLELQTERVTVVVFADAPERAERIVEALRSDDGAIAPGRPLPAPAPGALEGVVDC